MRTNQITIGSKVIDNRQPGQKAFLKTATVWEIVGKCAVISCGKNHSGIMELANLTISE